MSNEKQETIDDIVSEMRIGDLCANDTTTSMTYINDFLAGYADRIEAAVNRERESGAACDESVTDCNRLVNAAKMRDALVKADAAFTRISQSAWFIDANFSETKEVMDAGNAVASALSSPPRNCDRFSNANEALEAFEKETGETMIEFIRWLFAEARGGAK